jgi:uncharacterized protein YndB with AHSA1/START domain
VSETVTASATRVVDASRDKVWRAQIDPKYFPQWFGAKPGSVTTDLRSGGSWSAIVSPGGQDTRLEGKYVEVIEQRKLVMTIPNGPEYAEVTIVFTDLGQDGDHFEHAGSRRSQAHCRADRRIDPGGSGRDCRSPLTISRLARRANQPAVDPHEFAAVGAPVIDWSRNVHSGAES